MHVVEGATSGFTKFVQQQTKHEISGILAMDTAHDLVLLSVNGARAPALSLGESASVAVGDEVFVLGNPYGLEGTLSQGIVSGIRNVGRDAFLQITAPISPGSSGGPVLNSGGAVVGVAVSTFRGGQNLNFAIPVAYLKALLDETKRLKPLSAAGEFPRTQSPFAEIGESGAHGVIGAQFAWGIQLVEGPAILLKRIDFTFSLRNQLRTAVKNVKFIVIFYDRLSKPLEVYESGSDIMADDPGVIRPGLAKRATGSVDLSLRRLTARVEIRVLGFDLTE
jgi:hypothetical protein